MSDTPAQPERDERVEAALEAFCKPGVLAAADRVVPLPHEPSANPMTLNIRQLDSGFWHIRRAGSRDDWAQPEHFPTPDVAALDVSVFADASPSFRDALHKKNASMLAAVDLTTRPAQPPHLFAVLTELLQGQAEVLTSLSTLVDREMRGHIYQRVESHRAWIAKLGGVALREYDAVSRHKPGGS